MSLMPRSRLISDSPGRRRSRSARSRRRRARPATTGRRASGSAISAPPTIPATSRPAEALPGLLRADRRRHRVLAERARRRRSRRCRRRPRAIRKREHPRGAVVRRAPAWRRTREQRHVGRGEHGRADVAQIARRAVAEPPDQAGQHGQHEAPMQRAVPARTARPARPSPGRRSSSGTSAIRMPRACASAPRSSQVATATATATMPMNDARARISRADDDARRGSTPTPIAAGRFRPAREAFGRARRLAPRRSGILGRSCSRPSDHRTQTSSSSASLCFTSSSTCATYWSVRFCEFLLRPGDVVLAGLAVLADPVQLLLGLAADVADGDLGVLALGLGDLDQVPAALLGELRDTPPG